MIVSFQMYHDLQPRMVREPPLAKIPEAAYRAGGSRRAGE